MSVLAIPTLSQAQSTKNKKLRTGAPDQKQIKDGSERGRESKREQERWMEGRLGGGVKGGREEGRERTNVVYTRPASANTKRERNEAAQSSTTNFSF